MIRVSPTPLVVGVAGRTCAGKDTLVDGLIESLEARGLRVLHLRFSDALRDVLQSVEAPTTPCAFAALTFTLRKHLGDDVLARILVRKSMSARADVIVWNGVRQVLDVKCLRESARSLLVFVEASAAVARERFVRRARDAEPAGVDASLRAIGVVERELPAVGALADVRIDNDNVVVAAAIRSFTEAIATALVAPRGAVLHRRSPLSTSVRSQP